MVESSMSTVFCTDRIYPWGYNRSATHILSSSPQWFVRAHQSRMIHQHTERREGQWIPQDPSMAQLRQLVTEYCILPVGSKQVHAGDGTRRSIRFATVKDCGKRHFKEDYAADRVVLLYFPCMSRDRRMPT